MMVMVERQQFGLSEVEVNHYDNHNGTRKDKDEHDDGDDAVAA